MKRTTRAALSALATAALVASGVAGNVALVPTPSTAAMAAAGQPANPTDETKVPHYFGPWPNWANSPFTLSTAKVQITDPNGTGTGAEAVANLDPATGGIAGIDVTAPGHDYSAGTTVTLDGSTGTPATATPQISGTGAVTALSVDNAGSGYSGLKVEITGDGTGATAIASGGVDAVHITDGGSGYTMPTVDFDLPDDPNGTVAKGHVPMIANGDTEDGMDANGTITNVVVDDPGSGLQHGSRRGDPQRHADGPDRLPRRRCRGQGDHNARARRSRRRQAR